MADDTTPEAHDRVPATATAERDLEAVLSRLWSAKLGVASVGPDDDFFELGGDSLLAADLLMDIYQETGLEVDAAVLFIRPTIADLIEAVRGEEMF
jgi:acyl carrier protein